MKIVNIDGLQLSDAIIAELKNWYSTPGGESTPQEWIMNLDEMKNTFIKLMCDENNDRYLNEIKDSLRFILIIQDSLTCLVPKDSN